MIHRNNIKPIHISLNSQLKIFPTQFLLSLISVISTAIPMYLAQEKRMMEANTNGKGQDFPELNYFNFVKIRKHFKK